MSCLTCLLKSKKESNAQRLVILHRISNKKYSYLGGKEIRSLYDSWKRIRKERIMEIGFEDI